MCELDASQNIIYSTPFVLIYCYIFYGLVPSTPVKAPVSPTKMLSPPLRRKSLQERLEKFGAVQNLQSPSKRRTPMKEEKTADSQISRYNTRFEKKDMHEDVFLQLLNDFDLVPTIIK